ncbi:hydrogenase maturation protease [Microbaculum marinisediminis]|uniref:Hydrogenase maturation protease n=1 Tax=Microbaculum marinisediminis TaxID=2931392 RepID=A0AAW5R0Y9_9HYPH|nr:hydrogenase maturation protease [Microbaculum sp. A6E488]MCT8973479.1 hydrogenase maturation protease [Microbaculum sp. A6E488]
MTDRLVIGVGNADRGDDAAGLIAAGFVADAGLDGVRVIRSAAEPQGLMEAWRGVPAVWLVDACVPMTRAGAVHRFEAHAAPLPERLGALSSHGISLATTIELARALGALPPRLTVYAIEAAAFAPGGRITPAVAEAARRVADEICAELAAPAEPAG